MRYLRIPKNRSLAMVMDPATGQPGRSYQFNQWLAEFMFPQKRLREKPHLGIGLAEKLGPAVEGAVVALTDEEHEELRTLAKEANYPDILAADFLYFQAAVQGASAEAPPT